MQKWKRAHIDRNLLPEEAAEFLILFNQGSYKILNKPTKIWNLPFL